MDIVSVLKYCLLPFVSSVLLVPVCKVIGLRLKVYALENSRTVHSGRIVRIGGLAIFVSFMVSVLLLLEADDSFLGIVIGGCFVFVGGLLDDIYNISAFKKLVFQSVGAFVAIFYGGLSLDVISIGFINIDTSALSYFISFIWILGVCNAINLIDGLDGLSCGISFIILGVISVIGFFMSRNDIVFMSVILGFSILGFLPYNFFPASIFVGDCGALFIGYVIACISLLGFKTSAFITLGFPIIILFVPLADTTLAIIRRKLKGHRVSDADKEHLHHVLMIKLGIGHRNSVLLLYFVTILFGIGAIIININTIIGSVFLCILGFSAWLFIEASGMINSRFHPLIGLSRRICGYPKKSRDAHFEANRLYDEL